MISDKKFILQKKVRWIIRKRLYFIFLEKMIDLSVMVIKSF